jgi:hypothetical protein
MMHHVLCKANQPQHAAQQDPGRDMRELLHNSHSAYIVAACGLAALAEMEIRQSIVDICGQVNLQVSKRFCIVVFA